MSDFIVCSFHTDDEYYRRHGEELKKSLSDLGVTPTTLEAVLPSYLYSYRKGGQYADQDAREMEAGRA